MWFLAEATPGSCKNCRRSAGWATMPMRSSGDGAFTVLSDKGACALMETEVKYTVADPKVFGALLKLRAFGGFTFRPMDEQHLIDHYVDTPDRDLLRGGYACRLREGEVEDRWRLT